MMHGTISLKLHGLVSVIKQTESNACPRIVFISLHIFEYASLQNPLLAIIRQRISH